MTPPIVPVAASSPAAERMYALLPSLLRLRDGEVGQPLRALLRVLERELVAIEADVAQLYDNWFIETCEPWAVPYLADLLGIRHLPGQPGRGLNLRSFVANTLSYRRKKGTPGVLLQLARDLTDWPGRVVEYAPLVASTQHVLRPRPDRLAIAELQSPADLRQLGTPFDPLTRLVDVRRLQSRPGEIAGRHNLPNVGLFLWRRIVVSVVDAVPGQLGPDRFTFNPLGHDTPLYQPDRSPPGRNITLDTAPEPLTSDRLRADLSRGGATYFGGATPVIAVRIGDRQIPPDRISIRPLANDSALWGGSAELGSGHIAIDPERGRLLVANGFDNAQVRVSYSYPTVGELGDSHFVDASDRPAAQISLTVPRSERQAAADVLTQALTPPATANSAPSPPHVIQIEDSAHYLWTQQTVEIPAGQTVILRAAPGQRPLIILPDREFERSDSEGLEQFRPTVRLGAGAKLILQGLLFAGSLAIAAGPGSEIALEHCTLAPDAILSDGFSRGGQLFVDRGDYTLRIEKSVINHPIARGARLLLRDSFLLGGGEEQLHLRQARIERSTLSLPIHIDEQLDEATDSLFEYGLSLEGRGDGCVRFCFLRSDSQVLRRFRCLPAVGESDGSVRFSFRAGHHSEPGFGQLTRGSSPRILQGASDGGEIGAMNHLKWQQREADLRATLSEYTRVGYETEIFFED